MKITKTKPEQIILSAVRKYVEFIAPTYGPAGKKILIINGEFSQEAVDDGKRASQAFELENEFENAVIQYIKETTEKTYNLVKDGTTTSAIIMSAIVEEAFKNCNDELAGTPDYHGIALELRKGLHEAVEKIKKASKNIKTKDELYAIAHNSYNDDAVAKLIADTVFKIGKDGVLAIEDSKGVETTVEVVKGLEIDRGYISPYLINQDTQDSVVLSNPAVILVNKKLELFGEIAPVIKKATDDESKNIVIIADGFGEDVINKCIFYKVAGGFRPLLVEASGFGANKKESLEDIAIVTGATVIDDKILTLDKVEAKHLGKCDSIKSYKNKTTILGGPGKPREYINKLKTQLENSMNVFEQQTISKRIASLVGGVAVIKVGAYTEAEQKASKTKIENAVNATQLAYKSGVVPGAGQMFLDIKTSSKLLNEALKAPRKQLENNGVAHLDKNTTDPSGVLIAALETAVSIGGGLITMGGISAIKRKKEKEEFF